jgi:hypothetical protein
MKRKRPEGNIDFRGSEIEGLQFQYPLRDRDDLDGTYKEYNYCN